MFTNRDLTNLSNLSIPPVQNYGAALVDSQKGKCDSIVANRPGARISGSVVSGKVRETPITLLNVFGGKPE